MGFGPSLQRSAGWLGVGSMVYQLCSFCWLRCCLGLGFGGFQFNVFCWFLITSSVKTQGKTFLKGLVQLQSWFLIVVYKAKNNSAYV